MESFQVPAVFTLFHYYGGKFLLSKIINKILPKHKIFVDVFGGAGNIILGKPYSSDLEVYNDILEPLTIFFSVVKDKEKHLILQEKLESILNQYEIYNDMREYYREIKEYIQTNLYKMYSDIDVAVFTFYAVNLAYSGHLIGKGFSYQGKKETNKQKKEILKSKIDRISYAHKRFRNVVIENRDFREILKKYDSEDTLFYLDPPYVHESRTDTNSYLFEMSVQDHNELIDMILNLKGKFILSGYDNTIYKRLEQNGMNRYHKNCKIMAANKARGTVKTRRDSIEVLWTNYSIPKELLDECKIVPYLVNKNLEKSVNYDFQMQIFKGGQNV